MPQDRKLTEHAHVKAWANASQALPACIAVLGETGGAPRLRFASDEGLETTSWHEFFEAFDENDLALMVQDTNRQYYEIVAR